VWLTAIQPAMYNWDMARNSQVSFGLKSLLIAMTVSPPVAWLAWKVSPLLLIATVSIVVIVSLEILETRFISCGRYDLLVMMAWGLIGITIVAIATLPFLF
jgi:FtsH-binding integral membrane protein